MAPIRVRQTHSARSTRDGRLLPAGPHDGIRALQRSVGNRAVCAMLLRALLTWTGTEWRVAHQGPLERVATPSFAGEFIGQTYDTETDTLSRAWVDTNMPTRAQNCTDFAFDGDPDLALVSDLDQLLTLVRAKGYEETSSGSEASVVLYGRNGNYSHAIRRVHGAWYEVSGLGGTVRRYAGAENPPAQHTGDHVVAMLKKTW